MRTAAARAEPIAFRVPVPPAVAAAAALRAATRAPPMHMYRRRGADLHVYCRGARGEGEQQGTRRAAAGAAASSTRGRRSAAEAAATPAAPR